MNQSDLRAFEEDIKRVVPGFQVAGKSDSWSQRLLGKLLFFNPTYMTGYISTFYPIVYFPTKAGYEANPAGSFSVLAHERVHLLDTKRQPLWFRLSYLLPQVLVVPFLILTLVAAFISWKFALVSLGLTALSAIPWPSAGRTKLEKRGYAMTMAVHYWFTKDIPSELKQDIKGYFVGWPYYKMSWSPSDIDTWLATTEQAIKSGTLIDDLVYGDVLQFMVSRGLLKT
jgi:hypothetical protein